MSYHTAYPNWILHLLFVICFCIPSYTVKVRVQESIFTRYMSLFKLHWCISLETQMKRPRLFTCLSLSSLFELFVVL
jgi:hypothetical protein